MTGTEGRRKGHASLDAGSRGGCCSGPGGGDGVLNGAGAGEVGSFEYILEVVLSARIDRLDAGSERKMSRARGSQVSG